MDIAKHKLVPKHVKVSDSEKAAILKEYKIPVMDLPKIMRTDQALAKISVKSGDVIKIERDSKTAGITQYYRVVIDG
ncbi:MAG TPA: DNA-directed RNA polymerase subunit H [Candidatus Nanoarchaeia archaeon]|nr:DNA-directed RNA polymerase subunit H [Candidatus Nanoarchaeia archaeon]